MNSLHIEGDRLLRFADGELGQRDAQRVRVHLESCWECRAELDQIHRAVGECVSYRKALRDVLPPPPSAWMDIHVRFAEIDSTLERPSWFARLATALSAPTRWVPVAAAAAALIVVLYTNRELPTVSAAELLQKAVAAERTRPEHARRYQIRTRGRRLTDPATIRSLETLAVNAHYSWDAPLSARSYQRWHDQLPSKVDEVTTDASYYQIRTSTQASELVEASLRLRSADYIPVESALLFRNHDRIEITELAESENPIAVTPSLPRPLAAPAVDIPVTSATAADELRVFAALRKLGADLGEPIEIKRSGEVIIVTALTPDPSRRQQLEQELGAIPHISLQFTDLSSPTLPMPAQTAPRASAAPLFEAELTHFFGGRVMLDRFTDQALELSDSALARAHALRRLSEHFPPEVAATLSPDDRQILRELSVGHALTLANAVKTLDQLATPVLSSMKAAPVSNPATDPSPAGLLESARHVEQLLAGLLTGASTHSDPAEIPGRLRAALTQLSNSADNYLASPPQ